MLRSFVCETYEKNRVLNLFVRQNRESEGELNWYTYSADR